MTTPSGDDATPESGEAAPPPGTGSAPAPPPPATPPREPGGTWTSAETTATPKPPQAWFTPQAPPPETPPGAVTRGRGLPVGLDTVLIGAAALLLLSVFLPWTSYTLPALGRAVALGQGATGRTIYGVNSSYGDTVVMAGMAALALAVAGRAVSRRFAPYAAIPGGLALAAIFHRGVTLGEQDYVTESVAWGYWVAALAAVIVIALGLAAAASTSDTGDRDGPAQS